MCIVHYHHTSPLPFFFSSNLSSLFHISPLPFPFMAKPSVSFPSFSNFAKVSSSFLQRALCSFAESFGKSEGQEEEPPIVANVAAPYQEEALPQGADIGSLAFSCLSIFISSSFPPPLLTLFAFAGADTGAKDPEPVVTEVVVEPAPNV